MTPFGFATATRIRFGRGTVSEVAAAATARAARRVLMVRSASVAAAEQIAQELRHSAEICELVARGEPDLPGIAGLCAQARRFVPDLIIAIGGGAVIDHGKALAALVPAPHDARRYLEVVGEGRPLDAPPLPLIAIPTTAGTGTEVTRNTVLQVPEAQRKVSLRDPRLYPVLALVDPDLCLSCPKPVTLASGLDAVTQVIEPFLCARPNPLTDALCRDAIPRGLMALRRLIEEDDPAAWDDMALTSLCGGLALANAGLGAVHGFAGVIGGLTGAAHGAICGALLPAVLEANARAAAPDSDTAARITWVQGQITAVYGSAQGFRDWTRAQGLDDLAALGVQPAMHDAIAAAAAQASSYQANPVVLDHAARCAILRAA
ncbi:MAG: iron-containing alcohol dehydrogenase [Roseinatronobacter sp.]